MLNIGKSYDPQTSKYLPALDSIRGLAFIFVFLYHTLHINDTGNIFSSFITYLNQHLYWGLDVFFVLSSFLLTWLGLKEYRMKSAFSVKYYFFRRILRIWPLYFLIMICAFLVFPYIAQYTGFHMTLPDPSYYIFFVANFYHLPHVFFLSFLWTISVEEQFYFIWGFALKFLWRYLKWVAAGFVIISISFGIIRVTGQKSFYTNTLFYLYNFGLGALSAIIFSGEISNIKKRFSRMNRSRTLIFYSLLPVQLLVFFLLSHYSSGVSADLTDLLARYVFVFYIALLLLEQTSNPSRWKFLENNRWAIFTGKISYGLYCYHGISITFINLLIAKFIPQFPNVLTVVIIFSINYLVASVSYFYFELPFLKLKSKFR